MKKVIVFLLTLSLLTAALIAPAFAVSPKYENTRAFLELLDANDIMYTLIGVDDDGDEKVTIDNRSDAIPKGYTIRLFFSEENDEVSLRVWNLVDFDADNLGLVLKAVNQANYDYKYVRFYVDESDYSITASIDDVVRANTDTADIILDSLLDLVDVMDVVYPSISIFEK